MFHLIVMGAEWTPHSDSFEHGRVLEHTTPAVKRIYAPMGNLDSSLSAKIPAVFMRESSSRDARVAHIGRITDLRLEGRLYHFDYTVDSSIPAIPNAILEEAASELGISKFEFQRTHWAIKDRDLFKVLLKIETARRPKPTVFQLPCDVDEDLVSVMMPFDAAFKPIYTALKAAAADVGMRCERADDIWDADAVIDDVASLIGRARVVISDLSRRNPNVFYETGIAHAIGRDVILIAQNAEDVPFDVKHIRYQQYLPNAQGRAALRSAIAKRLAKLTSRTLSPTSPAVKRRTK